MFPKQSTSLSAKSVKVALLPILSPLFSEPLFIVPRYFLSSYSYNIYHILGCEGNFIPTLLNVNYLSLYFEDV